MHCMQVSISCFGCAWPAWVSQCVSFQHTHCHCYLDLDVVVSCRFPFKYHLVSFLIWHEQMSSFAIQTRFFRNISRITMDEHISLSDTTGCAAFQLPKRSTHVWQQVSEWLIKAHSVKGFGVNFQRLSSEYPACWMRFVVCSSYNVYFVSEAGCDGPRWPVTWFPFPSYWAVSLGIWIGLCDHLVYSMHRLIWFHDQCRLAGISKFRKQARQWTSPVRHQNEDWPAGAFLEFQGMSHQQVTAESTVRNQPSNP